MKLFVQDVKDFLSTQPNHSASSITVLEEFGVEFSKNNLANLIREVQYSSEIKREYCKKGLLTETLLYLGPQINIKVKEVSLNDSE